MSTRFPSLPDKPGLADVYQRFPKGVMSLCQLHDELLRDDSELTVAERELIAALVSAVNDCAFCYHSHRQVAELFGMDAALIDAVADNPDTAPVRDELRPLLRYAIKLTLTPTAMSDADAAPVYAAGWSEQTLMDTVMITGLYNLMNRLADGVGLPPTPRASGAALTDEMRARAQQSRYVDVARRAIDGTFSKKY